MDENYRRVVTAIILNRDKKVLMCEHIWIDDAWQFPQGGIEEGEMQEETLLRELNEELAMNKLKIVGKMDKEIKYHFPHYLRDKYKMDGNIQRFFFCLLQCVKIKSNNIPILHTGIHIKGSLYQFLSIGIVCRFIIRYFVYLVSL